jgi:hypothetical protein
MERFLEDVGAYPYGFEVGYYAAYATDWRPGELQDTFTTRRIVVRAHHELARWLRNEGSIRVDDIPSDHRARNRFARGFVMGFRAAVMSRVVYASVRTPPWIPRQPL